MNLLLPYLGKAKHCMVLGESIVSSREIGGIMAVYDIMFL
jgi:hypothetical protein